MSEAKKTAALLKAWRLKYPDGLAWKINDRVARSRPDAMFIRNQRTTYVEFKRSGNTLTPGQNEELKKLGNTAHRTIVAYFNGDGTISYNTFEPRSLLFSYPAVSQADFLAFLA